MTERKGQKDWVKNFIPDWEEPGGSRKLYAAEMFHEYELHADEVGESPDYLNHIYRKELNEETIAQLREDHQAQDHHQLDAKPDTLADNIFE